MPAITPALAIVLCDAAANSLDTGAGTAHMRIYSGTVPATPLTALGGGNVLLIEFALPNPVYGDSVDVPAEDYVEAVANAVANVEGAATGDATFARLFDRDNTVRWQALVGETGGTEEVLLSSKSVTLGVETTVISMNLRYPKVAE